MKTTFTQILRNAWMYGLIQGVIAIILSLLIYIFDVNMFSIFFAIFSALVFIVAIPVTLIVLGTNNLRIHFAPERQISYLDAVLTCLVILVIGFLLSNIYTYIFNHYLDTEYMKLQMQKFAEMLEKYGTPQEKIDEQIAKTEKNMGLGRSLISSGIAALVLALLVSLFIRKKDKVDEKMI